MHALILCCCSDKLLQYKYLIQITKADYIRKKNTTVSAEGERETWTWVLPPSLNLVPSSRKKCPNSLILL